MKARLPFTVPTLYHVLLILLAAWLTGCQPMSTDAPSRPPATRVRSTATTVAQSAPPTSVSAAPDDTSIAAPDIPAMPADVESARVVSVIDGDTLDVQLSSRIERVRLIGLNTPESADPRRPVGCFGVEASAFAKTLLTDQQVFLEVDPTQGNRDQFDRLLRYVWLEDGRLVNLEVIAGGYGAQYTFDRPYKYRDLFRDAERMARDSAAGLWSPATCNGDFDAPADFGSGDGSCAQGCIEAPPGCTIKGNVNNAGRRIYHEEGVSDAYEGVMIRPSEGDRWFCTTAEASAEGFVPAP